MPSHRAFRMVADAHVHDAVECIYVNKGALRVYINGTEERLSAGDFVIFHSLWIHSMYTEEFDENEYYVMKLSTKLLYDCSPGEVVGKFALKENGNHASQGEKRA